MASTITQQLAKNLWLAPCRDPREAIRTWRLAHLNVVEFGRGTWGVERASRRYFGKPASELDDDEAAWLAASLPRSSTGTPAWPTAATRTASAGGWTGPSSSGG